MLNKAFLYYKIYVLFSDSYFNVVILFFFLLSPQLNGLDGRENLARDLGITEAEGTVGGPLLLEVVRKCQQKKTAGGEVSNINLKFLSLLFFILFFFSMVKNKLKL